MISIHVPQHNENLKVVNFSNTYPKKPDPHLLRSQLVRIWSYIKSGCWSKSYLNIY